MIRSNAYGWVAFVCGASLALAMGSGQGQLRKARVGDEMKAFNLPDIGGTSFSYQRDQGRVLALAFLAAHQVRSERAIAELKQIALDLQHGGHPFDLAAVIAGSEDMEYFGLLKKDLGPQVPLLIDRDDQLWGKLGIMATPTVLVADRAGLISWIRAGHSYDFAEEARSELAQALGLEPKKKDEPHGQVDTLTNDTPENRSTRHMKMGQLLDGEGRLEAAIAELRKAEALTPRSADVLLELGRLLCQAGQSREALSVVEKATATAPAQEADVRMLSGWAHRQLGDRALAEKLLSESVRLKPLSVRALYELGKVYQERGDNERAMELYDRALAAHFQEAPFRSTMKGGKQQDLPKGPSSHPE